ncbi:metallophosphoesterase [Sporolactobacillus sp. THM7-4]|nr:metallophosphoesterase [Sporolactobacillus sp. THM7-4]
MGPGGRKRFKGLMIVFLLFLWITWILDGSMIEEPAAAASISDPVPQIKNIETGLTVQPEVNPAGQSPIADMIPFARGQVSHPLFMGLPGIDFTIGVMPDTQYYSKFHPEIFRVTSQWFVDNRRALNLKYIFHVGDIVHNREDPDQWKIADKALKILDDARIPYGVIAGNHDVGDHVDYTTYYQYFGEERYRWNPWYGESYKNNRGHYDLIDIMGKGYLMLSMGWAIGDEEIAWMNKVLKSYPDRTAILCVHDYLYKNGYRTVQGQLIYQKVVLPNPNVMMVLNGHTSGAAHRIDRIDDNHDGRFDRKVAQILADYQSLHGGQGYIRVMGFDMIHHKVYVRTYSPYKGGNHLFKEKEDNFDLNLSMDR